MYKTEMLQDLKNKYPDALAVEMMESDDFIASVYSKDYLFEAVHSRLVKTKEEYDKQWASSQSVYNVQRTDVGGSSTGGFKLGRLGLGLSVGTPLLIAGAIGCYLLLGKGK